MYVGVLLLHERRGLLEHHVCFFIPHITLSPALQRKSELGRQQAGEAAAGASHATLTHQRMDYLILNQLQP